MIQINTYDGSTSFGQRLIMLRQRLTDGIKWWAEHQAWPATDEIRIERHRSTCG